MEPLEGSPPHARGRRLVTVIAAAGKGITPACAGKTFQELCSEHSFWDHPRMRGEDRSLVFVLSFVSGSPPHARGRLREVYDRVQPLRITPACAGKTRTLGNRMTNIPDHPRMRGEDALSASGMWRTRGSPPHARGRPSAERPKVGGVRITPACAGKT